jgi:hypothetical protein
LPNLASSEQGLADFEAPTWFAVFLPRGASEPIFRKLNQAAFATADTPSVQERLHVLAGRWWKDELTDYNPAGLGECIAPTRARAAEVVRTTKQYLLHHGYEGRLSTAGNLAFPFTPPEVSVGPAYRFNVYHLMRASDLDALFPLEIETV